MTTPVFIPDVSQYQAGLAVKSLKTQGYGGMIARASIGPSVDTEYARFYAEAKGLDFPFAAYHFLKSAAHTPIAVQVDACVAALKGDPSVPLMLDWEKDINSEPLVPDAEEFLTGIRGHGLRWELLYLPHWYWESIGSPGNVPVAHMVASDYSAANGATGYASVIFPGLDKWPQANYANNTTVLWQFSDRVVIDGYSVKVGGVWDKLIDCSASPHDMKTLISEGFFKDWSVPVQPPAPTRPPWADVHSHDPFWNSMITSGAGVSMTAAQRLWDAESKVNHIEKMLETVCEHFGLPH